MNKITWFGIDEIRSRTSPITGWSVTGCAIGHVECTSICSISHQFIRHDSIHVDGWHCNIHRSVRAAINIHKSNADIINNGCNCIWVQSLFPACHSSFGDSVANGLNHALPVQFCTNNRVGKIGGRGNQSLHRPHSTHTGISMTNRAKICIDGASAALYISIGGRHELVSDKSCQ